MTDPVEQIDAKTKISNEILERVLRHGFDACGITDSQVSTSAQESLSAFLNKNWHGSMGWMEKGSFDLFAKFLVFENSPLGFS